MVRPKGEPWAILWVARFDSGRRVGAGDLQRIYSRPKDGVGQVTKFSLLEVMSCVVMVDG